MRMKETNVMLERPKLLSSNLCIFNYQCFTDIWCCDRLMIEVFYKNIINVLISFWKRDWPSKTNHANEFYMLRLRRFLIRLYLQDFTLNNNRVIGII